MSAGRVAIETALDDIPARPSPTPIDLICKKQVTFNDQPERTYDVDYG